MIQPGPERRRSGRYLNAVSMEKLMYRASLAVAVLGLGALLNFGPAQAAPQQAGVIPAQWGGPPAWAGDSRNHCSQLRQQLDQLQAMQAMAAPWDRPGIEPGIIENPPAPAKRVPGLLNG